MKSSAKENRRLETSCKECVFAIYNNETQTGCKHERVGKFRDRDELIEAYDDDKLRDKLGKAARETVVARFSQDKFVDNWNTLFDEVVK